MLDLSVGFISSLNIWKRESNIFLKHIQQLHFNWSQRKPMTTLWKKKFFFTNYNLSCMIFTQLICFNALVLVWFLLFLDFSKRVHYDNTCWGRALINCMGKIWIKGVSLYRNCGAASAWMAFGIFLFGIYFFPPFQLIRV